MSGSKREEMTEGQNCIKRSFKPDIVMDDKMSGVCSTDRWQ
jgi:hypothetical protein